MKQAFYDAVTDNPIIAAIKDEKGLEKCLNSKDTSVVFVLYGDVSTIAGIVEHIKEAGKTVVDFISCYTKADGIISTRIEQIKRAKELSLSTIYRIFVIDSKVIDNLNTHIKEYADIVEILPGLMPKIIKIMASNLGVPIIAGGLISEKEDVLAALNAGAIAISTTNPNVWEM